MLLAEALLARGDRAAATAAAEDAVALEPNGESARALLAKIRLEDGSPDRAFDAIAPIVDAAAASGP
ncbi:hypothetical protein D3C83_285800 [compost metagenome]